VRAKTFRSCGAKWHYDWSTPGTITLTVVERDALAPRSGMTMTATPNSAGDTSVHADWGPHIKEPQRVAGSSHEAGYRSPVLGVLFQEGLRPPVTSSPAHPAGNPSSVAILSGASKARLVDQGGEPQRRSSAAAGRP
jgi:hypothetical protein